MNIKELAKEVIDLEENFPPAETPMVIIYKIGNRWDCTSWNIRDTRRDGKIIDDMLKDIQKTDKNAIVFDFLDYMCFGYTDKDIEEGIKKQYYKIV